MSDRWYESAPSKWAFADPMSRGFHWLIGVLLVVGVLSRAAPLLTAISCCRSHATLRLATA